MEKFRIADISDAANILKIYSPYITDTTASFEYTPPTEEEFRDRINSIYNDYPYIVYERDGLLLGYAYAHRAAEREAYKWSAELSVYIEKSQQGKHIGTRLIDMILKILKMQNVVNVYSLITGENRSSAIFHEKNGFTLTSTVEHMGYKHEKWLSVMRYEKTIGNIFSAPLPFIKFSQLNKDDISKILNEEK